MGNKSELEQTTESRIEKLDISTVVDALAAPLAAQTLEKTQISKYHIPQGHGFAAEDANHFADWQRGRYAEITGTSNRVNGADRIVDGVQVQSKYFRTASKTVAAAFDSNSGSYRYSGQVLEVPKDQYPRCLKLMQKRIAEGKVPGYSSPEDAEEIVKQGTVSYKQARNIARAGNIESLVFDAKRQAVTSAYVFGLSFVITFTQHRLDGQNTTDAVRAALGNALSSGSTSLIVGVLSAQLLRTRVAAMGAAMVRSNMKVVFRSSVGRQAVHKLAAGSLRKSIFGAAATNHVSKLLRTNAITSVATTVLMTTPDLYRAAFDHSISWRQFTKNLSVNAAGVVGGTGGWMGGAAVGAAAGSAVPIVGTAVGAAIGGIAGSLGGGVLGSRVAKVAADGIVDDDSKRVVTALRDELQELASEYMVTESEADKIASIVRETVNQRWLRRMFKETSQESDEFLKKVIRVEFEFEFKMLIWKRPTIALPTAEQLEEETLKIVETVVV